MLDDPRAGKNHDAIALGQAGDDLGHKVGLVPEGDRCLHRTATHIAKRRPAVAGAEQRPDWHLQHVLAGPGHDPHEDPVIVAEPAALLRRRQDIEAEADALLFDADGNGAGAAVQFASLGAGLGITAGDFVVI